MSEPKPFKSDKASHKVPYQPSLDTWSVASDLVLRTKPHEVQSRTHGTSKLGVAKEAANTTGSKTNDMHALKQVQEKINAHLSALQLLLNEQQRLQDRLRGIDGASCWPQNYLQTHWSR